MTPDELRAKIAADAETLLQAAKAEAARKTADGDKDAAHKDAVAKAYKEAGELSAKAHKAVSDLHEHVAKAEHISDEHKEACAKAHKAMVAAHKALGGKEGADDDAGDDKKDKKEAAAFGEAMKAIGSLQEQLKQLETRVYQPRAGGPGAALVTAAKGAGVVDAAGAVVSAKKPEEMSPAEREQARKAAFDRSRAYGIPADQFSTMGNETLDAMKAMAAQAAAE